MTPAAGWRLGACIGIAGLVISSISGACLWGCGRYRSLACSCRPERAASTDASSCAPGRPASLSRDLLVYVEPAPAEPLLGPQPLKPGS